MTYYTQVKVCINLVQRKLYRMQGSQQPLWQCGRCLIRVSFFSRFSMENLLLDLPSLIVAVDSSDRSHFSSAGEYQ